MNVFACVLMLATHPRRRFLDEMQQLGLRSLEG